MWPVSSGHWRSWLSTISRLSHFLMSVFSNIPANFFFCHPFTQSHEVGYQLLSSICFALDITCKWKNFPKHFNCHFCFHFVRIRANWKITLSVAMCASFRYWNNKSMGVKWIKWTKINQWIDRTKIYQWIHGIKINKLMREKLTNELIRIKSLIKLMGGKLIHNLMGAKINKLLWVKINQWIDGSKINQWIGGINKSKRFVWRYLNMCVEMSMHEI